MMKKTTKKKTKKINPNRKAIVKKPGEKPHLTYDEIEWIKALLAVNTTKKAVADITNRSADTITRISKLNEEEIEQYRSIKRKAFINKAWEKIEMLLKQVTEGKCAFATINQITTAMGTIYDKAALASGEVTERVEVKKDESELVFDLAVPGLDKEDIEVTLHDNVMTISYEKKEESEEEKNCFLVRELKKSSFSRSLKLDETFIIDEEEEIISELKNGLLKIIIPLKREKKKESIKVKIL